MKIVSSSICKIGGREYNQDFTAASLDKDAACFVVCDGLGSYVGSEVASRLCATKIIDQFEQIRELDSARSVNPTFAEAYIKNAHDYVYAFKEKNPQISSSCTTVSCVTTDGVNTSMAHIGDTRIYFFRNYRLAYQSKDHSLSQLAVERGELLLRDIRTHKDQNKLTRVLGSDYFIPPDVDKLQTPLLPGDAFIICSDGFWEYVYEEEMEADLAAFPTEPSKVIATMESRLLSRIKRYNDNYTVVVAMVIE